MNKYARAAAALITVTVENVVDTFFGGDDVAEQAEDDYTNERPWGPTQGFGFQRQH